MFTKIECIFICRNGLTTDTKQIKLTQSSSRDDVILSREERAFRMWINSQVNQKMILTLTASIMYWSLQRPQQPETPEQP
jgi:hypothetical protein